VLTRGLRPLPDQATVPIHLPHAVIGDEPFLAAHADHLEPEPLGRLESNRFQRDALEPAGDLVQVGDLEPALPELRVPADAVQEVLDRQHGRRVEPA
jgi:hypothetical protein